MNGMLKKRKLKKELKEYLHLARHARHMREDIASAQDLASLDAAEAVVLEVHQSGRGDIAKACETLEAAANKVYPYVRKSATMEWTETIIVALGAAMAIRAFFFQPFKIPTGSMQPTLNGIRVEAGAEKSIFDNPVTKFPKWLVTGTSYKEFRAEATGPVGGFPYALGNKIAIDIGGVPHVFPSYMHSELIDMFRSGRMNRSYEAGQKIVGVNVIAGDHILVNKMKYNFMRPERGDISVFDTRDIDYPGVRTGTFYIKRMVGLPNEKIQIQNRRLVADGEIVREPPMFETIATDPVYSGGHATTAGSQLASADDFIQLGEGEHLMMGDNTKPNMSLDGRFFGGVEREMFQGPAIFVYWPFREHWGVVR